MQTKQLIICPNCEGHEKIHWYQTRKKSEQCGTCKGKGRVWQITVTTYEFFDEIEVKIKETRGM